MRISSRERVEGIRNHSWAVKLLCLQRFLTASDGRLTFDEILLSTKKECRRTRMTKLLNDGEGGNYHERGYHFPVNALSESEVTEFRGKLEDYEARTGGPIKGEMRHRSHVLFPWVNDMMRHPKILDAIEALLG